MVNKKLYCALPIAPHQKDWLELEIGHQPRWPKTKVTFCVEWFQHLDFGRKKESKYRIDLTKVGTLICAMEKRKREMFSHTKARVIQ